LNIGSYSFGDERKRYIDLLCYGLSETVSAETERRKEREGKGGSPLLQCALKTSPRGDRKRASETKEGEQSYSIVSIKDRGAFLVKRSREKGEKEFIHQPSNWRRKKEDSERIRRGGFHPSQGEPPEVGSRYSHERGTA